VKTAIFKGAGSPLVIEERPTPRPLQGQALIRVARCGICGSDLHMTSGSAFDVSAGSALGHEYAGEVVEVASGSRLQVGDRVTALPMSSCGRCAACLADRPLHCPQLQLMAGGYAEFALVDERNTLKLPENLSFADGALAEPLAAALCGVRRLCFAETPRVAVIGVGALGASAIFWARRLGAGEVTAIARTTRGAALATAMGADRLVTTGEDLSGRVARAMGGPADIVIEAAGAPGVLQQAIDLVRPDGVVLSLGGCVTPDPILPALAMWKSATLQFSAAYGLSDFRQTLETLSEGPEAPRTMVERTIGLDDLPAAFEAMRSGGHAAKVMVAPHGP
jgi:(R,R)-butanediol dehydrogenase/meso-butanediol dehydrogenase/diacetyl reductase